MDDKKSDISAFRVIDIVNLTHDTKLFRFELPENTSFDLLAGDHVKVYPDRNRPLDFRPYTPTSTPDTEDHFELIIKRYPDGLVSGFMHDRKYGDEVWMSGPHEGGHFEEGMAGRVGMVAGGTGITPMISMIRTILKHGIDVEMLLLFANKTIDDIILKDEFDRYADQYDNFRRYYVVTKAPDGWEMGVGRIDSELMKDKLPGPSDDTVIFACGPPMMQLDLRKKLIEIGHAKERVIFP